MSNISHLSLSKILKYVSCPLKYTLNEELSDPQTLYNLYRETCSYYLSKKNLDINMPYDKIHRFFNKIYARDKHKLAKVIKQKNLISLVDPLKNIYLLLDKWEEVIASNYESYIELEDYIIHAPISFIFFNRIKDKIRIGCIPEEHHIRYDSPELLYLYAYMSLLAQDLDFLGSTKIGFHIYLPHSGEIYEAKRDRSIKEYKQLMLDVCRSICNNNFYPRPTKLICYRCLSRKNCIWKI